MHRRRGLLALLAVPLFTAAIPHAVMSSPSIDVADADNAFGFRLLNAVQRTTPAGNVILSPVSAALNLSMVLNGADAETKQEIQAALSLSGSDLDTLNAANAQLVQTLRTPAVSTTLSVADSVWADSRRATLRPDYVKRIQVAYDAEIEALDFSNGGVVQRINGWASRQTQGKIPKVIDRIEPGELVLLLNAVYFKGQWTHRFDESKTQQRDFTLDNGSTRPVARMAQSGRFEYFETPQLQAIRLPFGAGDLIMEVLLPAKSSSLGTLEAQLTPERWRQWRGHYAQRSGTIELPRFELQSRYRLNDPLQALGIKRAFEAGRAQLTQMLSPTRGQNLSISSVVQSTYWKVDEEGSQAAAVTTTGIRATAVRRPEEPFRMVVDRPFLCAIQDQRSGALLFIGAIYDPGG